MAARKKRPAPRRRGAKRRAESFRLHVVSDATGSLARHLLSAVLTQFPTLSVRETYHLFKQDRADVEALLRGVRPPSAIVCYALVNPEHKAFLQHECDKKGVPAYDLTGGLATFLSRSTGLVPVNDPDRLHVVDAHYQRRIEAMEFTAQHDDGRRIDTIGEADIVIVGLSRVSKSPTSTFLGSLGFKVANVSISEATGFPPELAAVRRRTVAFTATPRRLHEIRTKRFRDFDRIIAGRDLSPLPYTNLRAVISEVVYAEKEYRRRGYPIIDITDSAVEEVAARTLLLLKLKKKPLAGV